MLISLPATAESANDDQHFIKRMRIF